MDVRVESWREEVRKGVKRGEGWRRRRRGRRRFRKSRARAAQPEGRCWEVFSFEILGEGVLVRLQERLLVE